MPATCKSFARSHWVKNGLKVAVAGDITAPALAKLLGETFQPVSGAAAPALPNVGRLGAPGVHVVAAAGAAAHRHVRPAGHHAP